MYRKKIEDDLEMCKAKARDLAAKVADREWTPEETEQRKAIMTEAEGLRQKLAQAVQEEEELKALNDFGGKPMESHKEEAQTKDFNPGKAFVEGESFKNWFKQVAPTGLLSNSKVPDSPSLMFKTLLTSGSATSAGAFNQIDYTGIYEPLGRAPLSILNLVARGQTTSPVVEYVRQTAQITQAANVQESNVTTYAAATGEISGNKPEGAMTFEQVTQSVQTIAAWIPATRRAISDAGQLMSLINSNLLDDLKENLEYQMVAGNGSGANFTGIENATGVLTYAWSSDIYRTTREAITYLRVTGRTIPTAWLMNPADWEDIDLEKDGENRYYHGGPVAMGTKTLWGVPVVECEHVTEGTAILGNFRKAMLWNYGEASVRVSDSHSDFFIRNMIAVLGEMSAAFGLIRPSAFCKVAMESGT